jgi:hypothetical protein
MVGGRLFIETVEQPQGRARMCGNTGFRCVVAGAELPLHVWVCKGFAGFDIVYCIQGACWMLCCCVATLPIKLAHQALCSVVQC